MHIDFVRIKRYYNSARRKKLLKFSSPHVILNIRKAPTPKVDASRTYYNILMDTAYPVVRQDKHFYFFLLFLLLRKVRNVTVKLPKEISRLIIPINIKIISAVVILRTSLPMYSRLAGSSVREAAIPVMGTFPVVFSTSNIISSI